MRRTLVELEQERGKVRRKKEQVQRHIQEQSPGWVRNKPELTERKLALGHRREESAGSRLQEASRAEGALGKCTGRERSKAEGEQVGGKMGKVVV